MKSNIISLEKGVKYTFFGVEAIEKAQEFVPIGTQYVDDISRLVLVGYEELQHGRVKKVSTQSRPNFVRYQGIEVKPWTRGMHPSVYICVIPAT